MRRSLPILILGTLVALCLSGRLSAAEMPNSQKGGEQYVEWTRRVTTLALKNLDNFKLTLEYHGPAPRDGRSVYLSVQPAASDLPSAYLKARLSKEEAAAIVGHLAASGFLYRGSINREKRLIAPKEPYYTLSVSVGDHEQYFEHIPWTAESYDWHWMKCPPLHQQIDALRIVVVGEAAKALDALRKQVSDSPPGEKK
jgi:hypothetical protein